MARDAPAVLREGSPWPLRGSRCPLPGFLGECALEVAGCAAPWGPQSHSLTLHLFICPVGVRAACGGPWAMPAASKSEARPAKLTEAQ